MSDTYGPFGLTYLEPSIDKVKDVAAWTEGFVQEVTDTLTTPQSLGTFTGTYAVGGGTWAYSVTMHRFLALVQIVGSVTRGGTTVGVDPVTGAVGASLVELSGVPLPLTRVALASGVEGTTRASDYSVSDYSGNLMVTLNRTQPIGNIAIGETLNFSGIYFTTGV